MAEGGDGSYRPGLDGLRAISVSTVLAFHLDRLGGGNLGVDAFFAISGWLITWKLLAEIERTGTVTLRRFWTARVRRLMPASLAVIAAVAVVWPVSSFVVPNLRRDLLFAVGWSSNWGTISGGGNYWARFGDPSPLTHFWSLAIEEQFYLVWPVVLVCVVGCGRRLGVSVRTLVGGVALIGAIASAAYMMLSFNPLLPTATYMNTFARAHSLLFGAAAAAVTTNVGTSLRGGAIARRLAPLAAFVLVVIVLASSANPNWLFTGGFTAFAIAMTVVVVAVADGACIRWLAAPAMRWISDRSYGLYLWHWPIFLWLAPSRVNIGLGGAALDVTRVGVAIVVADLSYRLIESPIRRRRTLGGPSIAGSRSAASRHWEPVAAGGALAGCVAAALLLVPSASASTTQSPPVTLPPSPPTTVQAARIPAASGGEPAEVASLSPPQGDPADTAATETSDASIGHDASTVEPPPGASPAAFVAEAPTMPAPLRWPVRIVVAGDSTAHNLSAALLPWAQERPTQLVAGSGAYPGCGLSADADGRLHEYTDQNGQPALLDLRGCIERWESITERVTSEQIDVVLMMIGGWDAVDIHLLDGRVVSVGDPVGAALIESAYTAFVDQVTLAGARVIWITPPNVHLRWSTADGVSDPQRWIAIRAIIDRLDVARVDVEQINLAAWLTANGLDGPDARPDGVHLTEEVNRRFVEEVLGPSLVGLGQPA